VSYITLLKNVIARCVIQSQPEPVADERNYDASPDFGTPYSSFGAAVEPEMETV
jgi:hypothetical protein